MIIEIVVPNLGESIKEATLTTWYKKAGDAVSADEALLELETDKVTIEVPAPSGGVLVDVLVAEGDDVEVGTILARLDESAQAAAQPRTEAAEEASPAAAPQAAPVVEAPPAPAATAATAEAPAALDPSGIVASGPDGRVTVDDLQAFFKNASRSQVERSGPAVRKLIAESGLDPSEIPASGRDGRFTKEDVETYLATQGKAESARAAGPKPSAAPAQTRDVPAGERREERVRMSRLRRTIATRLKEVQNTAAILTTFNEADMSAVAELRRTHRDAFEAKHGVRLGFMSFFVKACVAALRQMPQVNASIDGEEILYKHYYDIGMAVSTDDGLKVPVVRDADTKSFAAIEKEIADLAVKARDGTLTMEEMEGSTFSITNGGVFGSLLSTPILNAPNSAILGLHKIEERPVVVNGEIVIRPMMYLALSYDHRMIDGRDSVTFLVRVKELIEDPSRLMLDT